MKATHSTLVTLAELGILRSMPSFLAEPLKPGRLRSRFMEVEFIVDQELKNIYANNPDIYIDNKQEITVYLEKFGKILNVANLEKEDIHVASVVCFCLCFLENTQTKYPEKLYTYLQDIVSYYERADNIQYGDFLKGKNFHEEWERINNG